MIVPVSMDMADPVFEADSAQPGVEGEAQRLAAQAATHAEKGAWAEALERYDRLVKLRPLDACAHGNRGRVLRALGRLQEGLESTEQALKLTPEMAGLHNNRGVLLRELARLEEARAAHERAVTLDPGHAGAWKNLGIVLADLLLPADALGCHEQACTLSPQDAQAFNFRGNMLHRLGRHAEAEESHAHAIELRPPYAEAHYNRSIPLRALLRLEEAISCCEHAVALNPHHADAWWNLAEMLILTGQGVRGWPLYEWRWRSAAYGKVFRRLDRPVWRGLESLEGRTLLVNVDGGFGDMLHFCRYVPLLHGQGARVVVEAQPALVALLQHSFPDAHVVANGTPLPAYDLHIPMMSLPGAFVMQGNVHPPGAIPYLSVPGERVKHWATRLGERSGRARIGLVASGSTEHSQDHLRSISFEVFGRLTAAMPHAEFHCLQKVIRPSDHAELAALPVRTWEAELEDFADTAALVQHMDLVISVDTSVAHLAGALGRQVWVLLPHVPDMRWLLQREDSPWYPGVMRLFRQGADEPWGVVVAAAATALRACLPDLQGSSVAATVTSDVVSPPSSR